MFDYKRVAQWLENRPKWMSFAFNDLQSDKDITSSIIDDYSKICIAEISGDEIPKIEINTDGFDSTSTDDSFSIISISDVKNVNAIDETAEIQFKANGLTVIYGKNGSGKSGYVRTLYNACGSKTKINIKQNIYKQKTNHNPTCILKISNIAEPVHCDLSLNGNSTINGVHFFDSNISQEYIGDSREASFEPKIFTILSNLAAIADNVRLNLSNEKNSLNQNRIIFPPEIIDNDLIKKIQQIDAKSDISDFEVNWNDFENKNLLALEKLILEESSIKKIEKVNGVLQRVEYLNKYVNNIDKFLKSDVQHSILSTLEQIKSDYEQIQIIDNSFKSNSDQIDSLSISIKSWKKLWELAREYTAEISDYSPSIGVSTCPLCHQNLDDSILKRFNTVDQYVNSRINSDLIIHKQQFQDKVKLDFELLSDQILTLAISACEFNTETSLSINNELEFASRYIIRIKSLSLQKNDLSLEIADFNFEEIINAIECHLLELNTELSNLKSLLVEDKRAELKKTIDDLKSRKFVYDSLEQIKERIQIFHKIEEFDKSIKLTATNTITTFTNSLSEELLTKEYEARFNNELAALTGNIVKVKLIQAKSGKGRVPFKIVVTNNDGEVFFPNEILSEGEKKSVSLAAFIADALNGDQNGPLIFDDPISSLDYDYEALTVSRLVNLAKNRQVIVFTHRLSMSFSLISACEDQSVNCSELSIISQGNIKGIPGKEILGGKNVRGRINDLVNNGLPSLSKIPLNDPSYLIIQKGLCSEFRNIVEKSIEEILMCEIVKRYERDIRSTNVLRLTKITENDCIIVDKMMTKYSYYGHSQPDETPCIPIDFLDLEKDFTDFKSWVSESKKRILS